MARSVGSAGRPNDEHPKGVLECQSDGGGINIELNGDSKTDGDMSQKPINSVTRFVSDSP